MGTVRYETENGIARLVLDQPQKMNAMSYEMWASLPGLVARAEADREVRAIVVSGEGGRAFAPALTSRNSARSAKAPPKPGPMTKPICRAAPRWSTPPSRRSRSFVASASAAASAWR